MLCIAPLSCTHIYSVNCSSHSLFVHLLCCKAHYSPQQNACIFDVGMLWLSGCIEDCGFCGFVVGGIVRIWSVILGEYSSVLSVLKLEYILSI